MAHYAKVKDGIVQQVIVADEEFFETFTDDTAGVWIQTSYNTSGGKHYDADGVEDDGTPLRKNYAAINGIYDTGRDAFYHPQPFPSWTLNETTCIWECPVSKPSDYDGVNYIWNETDQSWDAVE